MELTVRQAAFLASEMERIEDAENRVPSAQHQAGQIREQAVAYLTE